MTPAQAFADGYAHFALTFLISAVIGFVFYVVKEARKELQEKENTKQKNLSGALERVAAHCADMTVTYEEKFQTYYVFNSETNAFIAQDTDALRLLENIRENWIQYDLKPANESTAIKFVADVRRAQEQRVA